MQVSIPNIYKKNSIRIDVYDWNYEYRIMNE